MHHSSSQPISVYESVIDYVYDDGDVDDLASYQVFLYTNY